jgi:hypothetical protein
VLVPELADVLGQVRARIEQYAGKAIGEQNTKGVLIAPVLRALGWDMENLEEVQLEYKRRSMDNPVDYALFVQRTPRLFVEAKGLGGNIADSKWAGQIMGYAVVAGVEWVCLTDGDSWHIYNSHVVVPVDQKLFRRVRISEDGAAAAETLSLLSKERMQENLIDSLWKAHFVDRQLRARAGSWSHPIDSEAGSALDAVRDPAGASACANPVRLPGDAEPRANPTSPGLRASIGAEVVRGTADGRLANQRHAMAERHAHGPDRCVAHPATSRTPEAIQGYAAHGSSRIGRSGRVPR